MKLIKFIKTRIRLIRTKKICRKYDIINWTLNDDGTVDVDDCVYLSYFNLARRHLNFGRVEGTFHCHSKKLTSLEGCPQYVGSDFYCGYNRLTSLLGCPKYVGGLFDCCNNNIRSFEGIGHIGGFFYCYNNPISVLWDLFRDVSKFETFNEWEVIQNDQVILYRLNDFLAEIGKDDVTEEQLNIIKKYYDII